MLYSKLFSSVFRSSLMDEEPVVRLVFHYFCLLVEDPETGYVYGTESSLARTFNVSLEDFRRATERLELPDPKSTSPDEDGRRLIRLGENLWQVVNFKKYWELSSRIDEREARRKRVARYRERLRGAATEAMEIIPEDGVLRFPCRGLKPAWWLTRGYVSELQSLFPGIDVEAEARKALAWIEASPERRKTASGMKRFLVGWLNRAANWGSSGRGGGARRVGDVLPPLSGGEGD